MPAQPRGPRTAPRGRYSLDGAVRGPHGGLRGSLRPAAAPRAAQPGRRVRGVAVGDRRRVRRRAGPDAGIARPRGRDGVRPRRRHADRAEDARPAPRAAGRRRSTRSLRSGSSATCCSPDCWPARPSRTRLSPLARLAATAERSIPRRSGPEEAFVGLAPDLLAGVTPADLRAALLRALVPKPVPRVDLDHVAPIRASVADAVERARRRAAQGRADHLPAPDPGAGQPARGDRALPRRARAVQAGRGRAGAARHVRLDRDRVARAGPRARSPGWSTPTTAEGGPSVEPMAADLPPTAADTERRRAIEAVLMVADEPVLARDAGAAARDRVGRGRGAVRPDGRRSTTPRTAASCWPGWPAGTASRAIRTSRRTSSGSSSRASRRGCRRPPSRRWPSSPTNSRCPRAQVGAIRGVNVDGGHADAAAPRVHRRGRQGSRTGPGGAVRDDPAVPREARARLARRAAQPGRSSSRPATSWRRSSAGCAWRTRRGSDGPATGPSGCRRCSPGAGSGAGGPARS